MAKNYNSRRETPKSPKPKFLCGLDAVVRFVSNALLYFVVGSFVVAAVAHYLGHDGFTAKVYDFVGLPFFIVIVLYTLMALMITSRFLSGLYLPEGTPATGTRKDYKRGNQREPRRSTRQVDDDYEPAEDGFDPEEMRPSS